MEMHRKDDLSRILNSRHDSSRRLTVVSVSPPFFSSKRGMVLPGPHLAAAAAAAAAAHVDILKPRTAPAQVC
jgi:hypothetical protein